VAVHVLLVLLSKSSTLQTSFSSLASASLRQTRTQGPLVSASVLLAWLLRRRGGQWAQQAATACRVIGSVAGGARRERARGSRTSREQQLLPGAAAAWLRGDAA
jgi:hypothetical protein